MAAEVFPKRLFIVQRQYEQLRALLTAILPANPFYAAKFGASGSPTKIVRMSDLAEHFPFTTKAELIEDQRANPPYGTNLTYPLARYTRCHQTSGTAGAPLRWLDTPESWAWMLANWERVLRVAGVTEADKLFFPFSFGPFLGFWLAFEAAQKIGSLCLPGGGMSSATRLRAIFDHGATVLCCTPTYALHLAEVTAVEKIDLTTSPVKLLLVAGEPGGSIPSVRARLEAAWPGARVADHHGMTEVGPVTYQCPVRPGVLHVMESAYFSEVIDPATGQPVAPGHTGELVLSALGRLGSPLVRYRTGDLVRPALDTMCDCGSSDLALEGGILARTDDMVVVRGVNLYPSAVENIIHLTGGVAEYQVNVNPAPALTELTVQIESTPDCPDAATLAARLEQAFQAAFLLRIPVTLAPPGTLPRFAMKAKRWVKG